MCRFKSFFRVHVFWMFSSLQKAHMKELFCLDALEMDAASPLVVSASSQVESPFSIDGIDVIPLLVCLLPRSFAVRAETFEMMLARVEELSVEKVRMLAASNILGASSDLTEE